MRCFAMTHSRSAQRIRRAALGTVVAAFALSHAAWAQGRGRGGPPVGTFDVVWRPVRDGTPNVVAILHEDLTYRQIFMDGRALECAVPH